MSTQTDEVRSINSGAPNCRVTLTREFLEDRLPLLFPGLYEHGEFTIVGLDKSSEVDGIVIHIRKPMAYAVCTRHWKRAAMTIDIIPTISSGIFEITRNAIPADAQIVDVKLDAPNRRFLYLLEHESFEPVVLKPEEAMLKSAMCESVPFLPNTEITVRRHIDECTSQPNTIEVLNREWGRSVGFGTADRHRIAAELQLNTIAEIKEQFGIVEPVKQPADYDVYDYPCEFDASGKLLPSPVAIPHVDPWAAKLQAEIEAFTPEEQRLAEEISNCGTVYDFMKYAGAVMAGLGEHLAPIEAADVLVGLHAE